MRVFEFDTGKGRGRVSLPDALTSEERAEIFDDLARMERGEKRDLNFGDFRWKNADGSTSTTSN